jgi:tetratricopeptide (TPR) repeat protein
VSQSDFVTRGQALVNSGQYQEAVKVCRLGLLGRPTTVEGRVVLGQALLALKRYDEVLAEMRVALELDHGSFLAQLLKGEALLRKGDPHAAIEVLRKLRVQAPNDPAIDGLLRECERNLGRPATSASHPSVGYVGKDSGVVGDNTRHYPNHAFGSEAADEETTGGSFDQPTAIAAPSGKKRSGPRSAANTPTPSAKVLAVGDKSGTVEVDPELEGIELDDDQDDFGDIASPPRSKRTPAAAPLERGQVTSSAGRRGGGGGGGGGVKGLPTPGLDRKKKNRLDVSSVELVDDDLVEVEPPDPMPARKPGPGTRVRNAINQPSGPLDGEANPNASRPTQAAPAMAPPPHLAQLIANAPHVMEVARAQPSMTVRGNPGGPIAAALPTMAAAQPPAMMQAPMERTALGLPPPGMMNPPPQMAQQMMPHAHPTMAISPDPNQAWARATVAAQVPPGYQSPMAEEPTHRPGPGMGDPNIAGLLEPSAAQALPSGSSLIEPSQSSARVLKTGMRKGRSKLQIAIWLIIGGLVIAGGVVVGFKFRAMRLEKKIADTQEVAIGLAKADTWKGMVRSRDRLAGIAQASATAENRAALARTRAQIAYEFGDGVPEAKTAIDSLAGQGGLDAELATAYHALATNDTKAALEAAGRATKLAADDPAALYVTGQAALLAGDPVAAVKSLQAAVDKEGRPLFRTALARAHADNTDWAAALQAIDPQRIKSWYDAFDVDTTRELQTSGIELGAITIEHPAVTIQRARILIASGQLGAKAQETRALLEKIAAEGGKALNDQPRGVSVTQVAHAYLVLAELDHVTQKPSQNDLRSALNVGIEDQRFGEQVIETMFFLLDFSTARAAVDSALGRWATSRRARLSLAQLLLVQGRPREALDELAKLPEVDKTPRSLAIRGRAKLALGDIPGAKDDLDKAIERSNKKLESALVARAWADLAAGDAEAARTRIRSRFNSAPTPAVTTVWAAILRASGKKEDIKEAKELLEPVVAGAPSVDLSRAQLELARLLRDIGDSAAKQLYTKVIAQTGSREIQVETAKYLIEFGEDKGGREMFDELLKGTKTDPPDLLIEAARAHLLVGDHAGGADLLDQADKDDPKGERTPRWKYDRERGRLALKKNDTVDAALQLGKALESCGDNLETFFLAAEVVAADAAKFKELADKVSSLAKARIKDGPEAKILTGKLLFKGEDARKAYAQANEALGQTTTPRRRAQIQLGLAIVAYLGNSVPEALDLFELATVLDPTLYEAYIYLVDIHLERNEAAKAAERAKLAVQYNPDSVDAYMMMGRAAHAQRNKKLLAEMLTKVGAMAPNSDQLKLLQGLR